MRTIDHGEAGLVAGSEGAVLRVWAEGTADVLEFEGGELVLHCRAAGYRPQFYMSRCATTWKKWTAHCAEIARFERACPLGRRAHSSNFTNKAELVDVQHRGQFDGVGHRNAENQKMIHGGTV